MTDTAPAPAGLNRDALGSLEGVCVLLVEDDPASAKLESIVLRQARCHVQVTRDASSAVLLLLSGLRPSVILLDIHLPDMSGLELTRFLKANHVTTSIPVVALTSSVPLHGEAEARAAGCEALIRKPIDADVFAAHVATFIRTHP